MRRQDFYTRDVAQERRKAKSKQDLLRKRPGLRALLMALGNAFHAAGGPSGGGYRH